MWSPPAPLPLPVTISFWFLIRLVWWTVCPLPQRHNCILRGTDDTRARLIKALNSFLKDSYKGWATFPHTVSKWERMSPTMKCGKANTGCALWPNEKTLRSRWWNACQPSQETAASSEKQQAVSVCVYMHVICLSEFWNSWLSWLKLRVQTCWFLKSAFVDHIIIIIIIISLVLKATLPY